MVDRLPRTLLFPAAGFVVLLAIALLAMGIAHARPEGRLYRAASAYLADVAAGRGDAAARRADPAGTAHAREEAHRRAGQIWGIRSLEVQEAGRAGLVEVLWFQADGRADVLRLQLWAGDGGGRWRLAGERPALP